MIGVIARIGAILLAGYNSGTARVKQNLRHDILELCIYASTARSLLRRLGHRIWKHKPSASLIGASLFVTFELVSNTFGIAEVVCGLGETTKNICRPLGLGNLPTVQEEQEWARASAGIDCDPLRRIARANGYFAEQAQRRVQNPKARPAEDDMDIPLTVGMMPPEPTDDLANERLNLEVEQEANRACVNVGKNFEATSVQARFIEQSRTCERYKKGYSCTASGTAVCTFIDPRGGEICPAG